MTTEVLCEAEDCKHHRHGVCCKETIAISDSGECEDYQHQEEPEDYL